MPATLLGPHAVCSACGWVEARVCVLTFLEPHDCSLSIFFHHHLAEEKKESSHRALRAGSEMTITTSQCAGMPCAVGCRGHAHAVPQWSSLPSSPLRLNEGGECATMQQSRCRDGVVGGGREQQRGEKRREEKAQHLTHTCTTCCLCLQVWHAGGEGHVLLVVVLRSLCTLALAWG